MNKFDKEKRSFIKRLLLTAATGCLLVIVCVIHSCEKELDIKTVFPFELKVMPVPKSIGTGETVTMRFTINSEGNYDGVQYKIRYFQLDGVGKFLLQNKTLKPNDSFPLPGRQFILYYVSESSVTQSFDIWVSDNNGNEKKMSFQFNAKNP